ncbi:hypothetical protein CL617_02985 [archaeon]|nr:hypothetical protein [archaeon]|tara:strand:- start:11245 stop:11565 length:321 start_codon:yes stop_codon:yes gene_type:complete
MNKFNFDYSEYSDILHIHKDGYVTKGSAEVGDFTLDFDSNEEIVGIEIENASEFFNNLDIDKVSLNEMKGAEFVIDKRNPQCNLIFLKLQLQNSIKKIPIPMPVVA